MFSFNLVVALLGILFLGFLLYSEWNRSNVAYRALRLFFSTSMVLAFVFLIIPVSFKQKIKIKPQTLNLITEGTTRDVMDRVEGHLFTLDSSNLIRTSKSKVRYIADLDYYLAAHPEVLKMDVYGDGLDVESLKSLKKHKVIFHVGEKVSGITSVSWLKKLSFGEKLKVQGRYQNPTGKALKIKLEGFGKSLDSLNLEAKQQTNFTLSADPRQKGVAVFYLVVEQDGKVLQREPIPFEVKEVLPSTILILASSPDFDFKFLKNWLAEKKYSLVVRTTISQDKYSFDYLNHSSITLNRLTKQQLDGFDAVIIDDVALASMSNAEKTTLYAGVDGGLGLIVRKTTVDEVSKTDQVLNLLSTEGKVLKPLEKGVKEYLNPQADSRPIFLDRAGNVYAQTSLRGAGKVIYTTVSTSYQWQLSGEKEDYSIFWSTLIDQSTRKKNQKSTFWFDEQMPSINQKLRGFVRSNSAPAPKVYFDDIKLAPLQNLEKPFEWEVGFWTNQSGWHSLNIDGKVENIYVFGQADWRSVKRLNRQVETQNFVDSMSAVSQEETTNSSTMEVQISKWWFFCIFLVSISFLWYEQRFLS